MAVTAEMALKALAAVAAVSQAESLEEVTPRYLLCRSVVGPNPFHLGHVAVSHCDFPCGFCKLTFRLFLWNTTS